MCSGRVLVIIMFLDSKHILIWLTAPNTDTAGLHLPTAVLVVTKHSEFVLGKAAP
jgi:hypothetical protein